MFRRKVVSLGLLLVAMVATTTAGSSASAQAPKSSGSPEIVPISNPAVPEEISIFHPDAVHGDVNTVILTRGFLSLTVAQQRWAVRRASAQAQSYRDALALSQKALEPIRLRRNADGLAAERAHSENKKHFQRLIAAQEKLAKGIKRNDEFANIMETLVAAHAQTAALSAALGTPCPDWSEQIVLPPVAEANGTIPANPNAQAGPDAKLVAAARDLLERSRARNLRATALAAHPSTDLIDYKFLESGELDEGYGVAYSLTVRDPIREIGRKDELVVVYEFRPTGEFRRLRIVSDTSPDWSHNFFAAETTLTFARFAGLNYLGPRLHWLTNAAAGTAALSFSVQDFLHLYIRNDQRGR